MPQTLTNILIPTGIMLGIALLLGLMIVLVSRIFAVEKNEIKEKILEALPGANCGGCGFAGCEGYADYLSKNGANTALCAVGGVDCAREIAQILGKEAAIPEKKVAVILDVARAFDLRVERDDDQPPPDARVHCPYLRQMVGV